MTIRQATADDVFRLVEMSTRFLLSTPYGNLMQPTPEQTQDYVLKVLELGAVFVAVTSDEPPRLIGMLAVILDRPMNADETHLNEIAWWVEPEYRHSRASLYLLRSMEEWAHTIGAKVCKMVAPAGSDVGAFLVRYGYEAVETIYTKRLDPHGLDDGIARRHGPRGGSGPQESPRQV